MRILYLLFFCFFYTTAFAQTQIQGKIINAKGQPVFAANVFVKSKPEKGITTDFDGKFKLQVDSNNILVVSFIGYKTQEILLKKRDISKDIIITLKEDSQLLSEVAVVAQDPISEKFSVTKLKKLDIYFNPISQADPLKAITILPASTTVDETANPSLRGSSPDRTRVMLNGVPIYTPVRSSQLNNDGFFSLFNTEMIHQQYVYASNPPLTYGNSSAGLVEIQTLKNLTYNQCQFSLSIGSIGFFISQRLKNQSQNFVQLYGNMQNSTAFVAMQKKYLPYLKSFDTKDVGFNFHHKFGENIVFNSFNYYVDEGFKVNYSDLNYSGEANANTKRFFSVNNFTYYSSKGVLMLNIGLNNSKQHFKYGNIKSNIGINQCYASLNFKGEFAENINFQTGISFDYHQNRFNDSIPKYFFALSPNAPSKLSKHNIANSIVEAYSYVDWKLSNKLSLSTAVRSNIPVKKQEYYLNAQVGLKYKMNMKNEIFISAGKYNSYTIPNYYNKDFSLLTSKQFAADYSYTAKKLSMKTAVYYKEEKGEQAINSYFSIDKVRSFGIEAYIAFNISNYFKITASNAFINQKIHQGNRQYHGKYDFSYISKIALQYRNMKLFTASISYMGRPGNYYTPLQSTLIKKPYIEYPIPVFDNEINSRSLGAYNKIDFTINKYIPLKSGAIIPYLSISNIFNIRNEGGIYYNADYSEKHIHTYGKRIFYFGFMWELN